MNIQLLLTVLFLLPEGLMPRRIKLLKGIDQGQTRSSIYHNVASSYRLLMDFYERSSVQHWRTNNTAHGTIH